MNLSRMTREAEQRELRLRDDMEQLTIQQDQTLGTLDSKIDAMMERQTHNLSIKLKVISRQTFGMAPQGSSIQSIISVAGHQVIRNLSEPL